MATVTSILQCSGGKVINSVQQSPSLEANSSLASQETTRILWNPKIHSRVHENPPLFSVLSQINPVHTLSSSPPIYLILSSLLPLGLQSSSRFFSPHTQTHTNSMNFSSPSIPATFPAYFMLMNFITRIVFGEEHN